MQKRAGALPEEINSLRPDVDSLINPNDIEVGSDSNRLSNEPVDGCDSRADAQAERQTSRPSRLASKNRIGIDALPFGVWKQLLERLATNDLLPSEPHREEMRRFRDGLSRLAATTKGGRLTNEFKLRYREEAQD